jgi:RNA polymerase sigma-70 factor (ECF subfamily)
VLRPVPIARESDPEPDEALVRRARGGDRSAFDALYLRHARYVAGAVYRVIGHDEDLEDVIQEAFVHASRKLAGLRDPSRFRGWVVRIALREAVHALAKRRRRKVIDGDLARSAPRASDPRSLEPADALYRALDALPDKLRAPWSLNKIAGLALAETAHACSVSLATVKRRISAADKRLKRSLDED